MGKQEPLQYRQALVVYVDVLGFAEMVSPGGAKSVESVYGIIDNLRTSYLQHRWPDEYEVTSATFSDHILQVFPLDSRSNKSYRSGLLFHVLDGLGMSQAQALWSGVLVRGALTIGDIFTHNGIIFGPAMVRAYRLESEVAVYPRIVIDPDVLEAYKINPLLTAQHHGWEIDREFVEREIRRDSDGTYFVDYLASSGGNADDTLQYGEFLLRHKKCIESRLAGGLSGRAKQKLIWLASYHNNVVNSIREKDFHLLGYDQESLLVP